MPRADVLSEMPRIQALRQIIHGKKRWGVSAAALTYRLHKMGLITDWQYRSFNIQLRTEYGSGEPESIARETSTLWKMVLDDLWEQKLTRADIAASLDIPHGELENLLFGLTNTSDDPPVLKDPPSLSLVN